MEVRKGYKQTEVGVIPEDWDVVDLAKISHMKSGESITSANIDQTSKYPCYGGNGLRGYTNRYTHDGQYALIGRQGALCGNVVGASGKFFASEHAVVVTPTAQTDIQWLTYVLGNMGLNQYSESSAQPGLSVAKILMLRIAFPNNKVEQKAIAAALSDVDALLTSLDALIAKKRLIKQGAMQELLTGKKRLPGFSGEWNILELKEIVNQFIVPMRDKPKAFKGDIPWCRIEDFDGKILFGSKSNQNVDNETIKQMNLKVYPTGTLLVSCSADLGRCAIVGRPLVSNQTFIGLVFDEGKASNDYFYYYMSYHADDLNNLSSGTTISYLSREQFETFSVTVPSTKAEQTAIAEILSDMDAEIAALEARREKTRLLKQGMMQELLTGRIRLV